MLIKICIHCKRDSSEPNVTFEKQEHVMLQAFGKCDNNFVINTQTKPNACNVCDECNEYYGNTLDIFLSRGTKEGIERYEHKLKKPDVGSEIYKKDYIKICIYEGIYKGLKVELIFSSDKKLIIKPNPTQIGFKRKDGIYEFFVLNDTPTKEYINNIYDINSTDYKLLVYEDGTYDSSVKLLNERGINFTPSSIYQFDPGKDVLCKIETIINPLIQRALAKIAFNYLAYHNNSEIILQKDFDQIRNFIRYGIEPSFQVFSISDQKINSGDGTHYIYVQSNETIKITLLNHYEYEIKLCERYRGLPFETSFGHIFDTKQRKINKIRQSKIISVRLPIFGANGIPINANKGEKLEMLVGSKV